MSKLKSLFAFLRAPSAAIMASRPIGVNDGSGIAFASRIPQLRRSSSGLLYTVFAVFAALFVWASIATVDDLTRADGRVVPSARLQVVQNLEGGIVQALHARQGERVEAGALLMSLSATQFGAERDTRRQQSSALAAKVARLRAEVDGGEPHCLDQRSRAARRIALAVDGDDEIAAPPQELVDAEVLDVAAVGEVDEVVAFVEVAAQLAQPAAHDAEPSRRLGGGELAGIGQPVAQADVGGDQHRPGEEAAALHPHVGRDRGAGDRHRRRQVAALLALLQEGFDLGGPAIAGDDAPRP
jgi:multidrug efflux pump subunit AcrA (membrane-fusion protein)